MSKRDAVASRPRGIRVPPPDGTFFFIDKNPERQFSDDLWLMLFPLTGASVVGRRVRVRSRFANPGLARPLASIRLDRNLIELDFYMQGRARKLKKIYLAEQQRSLRRESTQRSTQRLIDLINSSAPRELD